MATDDKNYSFETGIKNAFKPLDFVIFTGMLLISTGIGVFYAIKDRNAQNTKSFLLAGGQMHYLPVTLSLLASFISALTLLGTPAEMYNYGTMYWWIGPSYVITVGLAAHVYMPIFFNLNLLSIYEYLELRFCKGIRTLGTLLFTLYMVIYMSIVLYGPSLALNAVTGLSLWGAVISVGTVCTIYTAIGGMKAVLWTDTFQAMMIIAGLLASLIQGSIEMGGFEKAWQIAADNDRVNFQDTSVDPRVRHSVWGLLIGGSMFWLTIYGTNQAQIQRILSCSNIKDARKAMWLNFPGLFIILILCCLVGIVLYAFYSKCDPITFNLIMASDQLYPLFVMDVMGHVPGVPGMFVSCIFSGTLRYLSSTVSINEQRLYLHITISSGLNSLSAVWLHDIVTPYIAPTISERNATIFSKITAVVFGAMCLGFAYLASHLGDILQAGISVGGALGGPVLGLFTLGIIFPWANKWGAYTGLSSGVATLLWITIGKQLNKTSSSKLPVESYGCNWNLTKSWNATSFSNLTAAINASRVTSSNTSGVSGVYSLSYIWYAPLAMIIVVSVGLVTSFITGKKDPKQVDPRLICPFMDELFPYLPEKFRRPFRFGINHKGKYHTTSSFSEVSLPINNHTESSSGDNNYNEIDKTIQSSSVKQLET